MGLRKRLGEILDAASAGERILIERGSRPLAYLVSYEDGQRIVGPDPERIQRQLEALDRLVAFGKKMRKKYPPEPGEMTAAEWVRWDRDHRDDEKYERSFGAAARAKRAKDAT
jgi:prevent-host-death family protein